MLNAVKAFFKITKMYNVILSVNVSKCNITDPSCLLNLKENMK